MAKLIIKVGDSERDRVELNEDKSMTIYGQGHKLLFKIFEIARKHNLTHEEVFMQFYNECKK